MSGHPIIKIIFKKLIEVDNNEVRKVGEGVSRVEEERREQRREREGIAGGNSGTKTEVNVPSL